MIIILLPLERYTIGQTSGYLQHVDRPSENVLEGFEMTFYLKKELSFKKLNFDKQFYMVISTNHLLEIWIQKKVGSI